MNHSWVQAGLACFNAFTSESLRNLKLLHVEVVHLCCWPCNTLCWHVLTWINWPKALEASGIWFVVAPVCIPPLDVLLSINENMPCFDFCLNVSNCFSRTIHDQYIDWWNMHRKKNTHCHTFPNFLIKPSCWFHHGGPAITRDSPLVGDRFCLLWTHGVLRPRRHWKQGAVTLRGGAV